MAPVLHLRPDIASALQLPGEGRPVLHLQSKAGGVQGQGRAQGGEPAPQGGGPPGHPPILSGTGSLQPLTGRVQGGQDGVGGAGGAVDGGSSPHLSRVDAVGEQQGRLPHGGQGLVGAHHHRVRSPVGIHPQKLQMGSVGTVHHQFSTVGVDYSRNGGNIRQQSAISW